MILRKIFNPISVAYYMRWQLALSTAAASAVYAIYAMQWASASLPFSLAAIMGSALAIFLAFRNNNAYARWWEARTAWANIANASRVFARQIIANTNASKASSDEIQAYQYELLRRQIAFAHALRLRLREQPFSDHDWSTLLPANEAANLQQRHNAPNCLLLTQGQRIKDGIKAELLGAFDNISLEPTLGAFNSAQAACERIKNTPLLRQYHFFTQLFLLAFTLLLPFALIGDFLKINAPALVIPCSILIAFVFGVMGKIGELNEDPFENRITDVPLSALCNDIERDLLEMLQATPLPEKMQPQNGFLF